MADEPVTLRAIHERIVRFEAKMDSFCESSQRRLEGLEKTVFGSSGGGLKGAVIRNTTLLGIIGTAVAILFAAWATNVFWK